MAPATRSSAESRQARPGRSLTANQLLYEELVRAGTAYYAAENAAAEAVVAPFAAAVKNAELAIRRRQRLYGDDLTEWRRAAYLQTMAEIEEEADTAFRDSTRATGQYLPEQVYVAAALIALAYAALPSAFTTRYALALLTDADVADIVDAPTYGRTWRAWADHARREHRASLQDRMARLRSRGGKASALVTLVGAMLSGGYGARRMEKLVRTESARIFTDATLHTVGGSGASRGGTWTATLDDRSCVRCGFLDGQTFWEVPGREPLWAERPEMPLHPRCRCVWSPVLATAAELGFTAADLAVNPSLAMFDGLPPEVVLYEEWMRDQPPHVQDEILGPGRGRAFRAGASLGDFVTLTRTSSGLLVRKLRLDQLPAQWRRLVP